MIIRENIILACGHLILDWESGLPTGSRAPVQGLDNEPHLGLSETATKESAQRACGNCWGGERDSVRSRTRRPARPEAPTLPAGWGRPRALAFPPAPSRTFPPITGPLQTRPTQTGLRSKAREEKPQSGSRSVRPFQNRAGTHRGTLSPPALFLPEHPWQTRSLLSQASSRVPTIGCPQWGATRSRPRCLSEQLGPQSKHTSLSSSPLP